MKQCFIDCYSKCPDLVIVVVCWIPLCTERVRKMKDRYAITEVRKQANRMTFGSVSTKFLWILYYVLWWMFGMQIEEDAYQDDLGFSTGQLGKGGIGGPIRGPTVDKKTQVSISKRLQVRRMLIAGVGGVLYHTAQVCALLFTYHFCVVRESWIFNTKSVICDLT